MTGAGAGSGGGAGGVGVGDGSGGGLMMSASLKSSMLLTANQTMSSSSLEATLHMLMVPLLAQDWHIYTGHNAPSCCCCCSLLV